MQKSWQVRQNTKKKSCSKARFEEMNSKNLPKLHVVMIDPRSYCYQHCSALWSLMLGISWRPLWRTLTDLGMPNTQRIAQDWGCHSVWLLGTFHVNAWSWSIRSMFWLSTLAVEHLKGKKHAKSQRWSTLADTRAQTYWGRRSIEAM